jgi:C1A family cysteine protease
MSHRRFHQVARFSNVRRAAAVVALVVTAGSMGCGRQDQSASQQTATASSPQPSPPPSKPASHTTGLVPPADLEARIASQKPLADRFAAVIGGALASGTVCDPHAHHVDLRSSSNMTDVRDQGQCGACWAFATIGAFESSYKVQNNHGAVDASEQQLVNCSGAGHCAGGWWAFDYLRDKGDGSRADVRYVGRDDVCPLNNRSLYRAVNWSYISPSSNPTANADDIKAALCAHGAVATAFAVTTAFQDFTGQGVFREDSNERVNHGIVIAGWDDTTNAWLIKNSWGTGWANQGYAWVAYGTNQIGYGAAWVDAKRDLVDLPAQYYSVLPNISRMPARGSMSAMVK